MGRYTIRRVSLMPFARFGCLLGALASFIPGLLCTFGGLWTAIALRRWLESWDQAKLDVLGTEVPLNFIALFGLKGLLEWLEKLSLASGLAGLAFFLFFSLAGGLLIGAIAFLVGLGYNFLARLTGGVVVELKSLESLKH